MPSFLPTDRRLNIVDRRDSDTCPLHAIVVRDFAAGEKRMDRLEEKIDALLAGKNEQALAIQAIQATLNNGLSGEIRRTVECVERMEIHFTKTCEEYDKKFEELSKFDWFRLSMNKIKDGMVFKALLVTVIGGFICGMLLVVLWLAKHLGIMT